MAVMGTKRETNQRSESGTYAGSAAVNDLKDTPEPTSEPFEVAGFGTHPLQCEGLLFPSRTC